VMAGPALLWRAATSAPAPAIAKLHIWTPWGRAGRHEDAPHSAAAAHRCGWPGFSASCPGASAGEPSGSPCAAAA
jgi:hypothetical protein